MNSFFSTIALAALSFNSIVASEGSLPRRAYDNSVPYTPVSTGKNYGYAKPSAGPATTTGSSGFGSSSGATKTLGSSGGPSNWFTNSGNRMTTGPSGAIGGPSIGYRRGAKVVGTRETGSSDRVGKEATSGVTSSMGSTRASSKNHGKRSASVVMSSTGSHGRSSRGNGNGAASRVTSHAGSARFSPSGYSKTATSGGNGGSQSRGYGQKRGMYY